VKFLIGINEVYPQIICMIWQKKVGSSIFTVMKLKHIVDFSVNNPDADFWIIRKGSETTVGKPTREFSPEHIGITVTRPDLVLADYLYYVFEYLANQGKIAELSHGTTNLRNIRISDLENISITNS